MRKLNKSQQKTLKDEEEKIFIELLEEIAWEFSESEDELQLHGAAGEWFKIGVQSYHCEAIYPYVSVQYLQRKKHFNVKVVLCLSQGLKKALSCSNPSKSVSYGCVSRNNLNDKEWIREKCDFARCYFHDCIEMILEHQQTGTTKILRFSDRLDNDE